MEKIDSYSNEKSNRFGWKQIFSFEKIDLDGKQIDLDGNQIDLDGNKM